MFEAEKYSVIYRDLLFLVITPEATDIYLLQVNNENTRMRCERHQNDVKSVQS